MSRIFEHGLVNRAFAIALLGTSALCGVQADAWAQSATAGAEVDEIIVTARGRAEALISVPVQIATISGDDIDARGATSLSELSAQVPGFTASRGQLLDSFYIRGVGTYPANVGFEQSVGLFIDGVYYGSGRWANQGHFDLASMQVLKGPQSVFFGKNTISGAVQMNTRNPGDEFAGEILAGYETEAEQSFLQGAVDVPITDSLAIRLFARASEMEGWIRNRTSNVNGPNEEDAFGRLTVSWSPSPDLEVTLKSSAYTQSDMGTSIYFRLTRCGGPGNTALPRFGPEAVPTQCGIPFTTFQTQSGGAFGDYYGSYNNYSHSLNAEWNVGPGVLTAVTGVNRFQLEYGGGTSYVPEPHTTLFTEFVRQTSVSQELRYHTEFEGPVNFVGGAYYQSTDFTHENAASILSGTPTEYTVERRSTQDHSTASVFGEGTWNLTPQVEFALGARYTHEEKESVMANFDAATGFDFLLPPVAPVYEADQSFNNTSGSATLTWRPTDEATLYVGYRTGYKSGGFSHGATLFWIPPGAPPTLESLLFGPETVEGFEGGVKGYTLGGRLRFDIGLYDYHYTDLQVSAHLAALNAFVVQNAASAIQRGIDMSASWSATDALTIAGNVVLNRAEFEEYVAPCNALQTSGIGACTVPLGGLGGAFGQSLAGVALPIAPEVSARLDVTYKTDIADYDVRLNAGAQYSSDYRLDQLNRPESVQEAYVRYNAGINITAPSGVTFALIGTNLTNEEVATLGFQRSGQPRDLGAWFDRGRQIEVRLGFEF